MSDQINGTTPNLHPSQDDYRQFMSLLLSVNTQLHRLATRMDAAEQRAAANDARAAANDARAAEINDQIAANNIRIQAKFRNLDRRAQNAACYRYIKSPASGLLPLIDLRTSEEIVGFPVSVGQLSQLDEMSARNILDALQIDHQNLDAASVLELLRFYTYYA
ncbi:hypothetical protein V8C34DRAFT_274665 [Trichoderma compactum]